MTPAQEAGPGGGSLARQPRTRGAGVSRRVLIAAAGALASGCGRLPVFGPSRFPIFVADINTSQAQAFANSTHGAVEPVPGATETGQGTVILGADAARVHIAGKPAPQWEIAPVLPFLHPAAGTFAPLDAALRAANFQAGGLLPGTLAAFAGAGGGHYAVPAYVGPWAVQYDPKVYDEVGLKAPAPDWTIDDFEGNCAAIASAISGGQLSRLIAVLPPLVGTYSVLPPPGVTYKQAPGKQTGQFCNSGLWGAFVEGFGGTVASSGRFDLTNTGAIAGLQRMVDIATRYSAPGPAQAVPTFAGSTEWHPATTTGWGAFPALGPSSWTTYAMIFAPTAQLRGMYETPMEATGWQWARFPRLPVRQVIPLQVAGLTVSPSAEGLFPVGGAPPRAPGQSLTAVAEFAVWWYLQYHTNPGLIGLPAPVLSDATVQHAYWNAPGQNGGFPAVGDWQNFAVVEAGWPLVPGAASSASTSSTADSSSPPNSASPVFDALTEAVMHRVPISTLLPQATQNLNSMVATAYITAQSDQSG